MRLRRSFALALLALSAGVARAATAQPEAEAGSLPVWIDTDPACGQGRFDDVDDCWALLLAFGAPEIRIVGVSSVFGNADVETTHARASELARRAAHLRGSIEVHRGAARAAAGGPTDATRALARALRRERLRIVALGPLTNLAALLQRHPELEPRIESVVAVAGTRPGGRRLFPGRSRWLHFHDLNFRLDPDAFERVWTSGVPVVLVPFATAERLRVGAEDLDRLATSSPGGRWLAESSRPWLRFWSERLGATGFAPFDAVAIAQTLSPDRFECLPDAARVVRRRSWLVERSSLDLPQAGGRPVLHCTGFDPGLRDEILARVARAAVGLSPSRSTPAAGFRRAPGRPSGPRSAAAPSRP